MALRKTELEKVPQSLVASAAGLRIASSSGKTWRFGDEEWQREAWRLYDIIGELRFVSNWIGGAVSNARLYVGEVDDNGEVADEVTDPQIARLASVPLGTGPARDENLRLLAVNLFVPGEAYIVGEDDGDAGQWWVLSGREIKRSAGTIQLPRPQRLGGGMLTFRPAQDVVIRVWTPHPGATNKADSPTRSAIPALRALELLMKREFAELDSRLTGAGVWFLPQGLDFPRTDEDPPGIQGFMAMVARAAQASMQDQSSAAAMVPVMATVPDHLLEHMDNFTKPTTFWSELSEQLHQLTDQAVRRVAMALDTPPEILIGVGTSNRWNAWLADEQVIKIHVRPTLARLADALTVGYLNLALADLGADPARYAYGFDTASLTVRPNRTEDAMSYHGAYLLSDEAARNAGAFNDEDAPDPDEALTRRLWALVERQPVLLENPTIARNLGLQTIETQTQAGRPREIGPSEPSEPREAPDTSEDEPGPDDRSRDRESNATATKAVATLAVLRALELANGRLTSNTERFKRWPDVPRHQLHTRTGPRSLEKVQKALEGAWEHLATIAADLDCDLGQLRHTLHGYCVELLTRGLPHSDDMLGAALTIAQHARQTT